MLFLLTILGFRFGTGREVAPTADELKRAAIRGSGINSILLGGCLGVATLLAGNTALSASGWSGPIDRFNWWENSRFPILRMITGAVCWPAVYGIGVGLANAMLSRNRLWIGVAGLAALLYLFFLVRMAQKYNGLIPPLIALVLPIAYGFRIKPVLLADKNASREQLKANRRLIATMAIIGAALVATAFGWFSSTWQNSKLAMGAFENLPYRVFMIQGHTYFGADYLHLIKRWCVSGRRGMC